jgi:hypothetical protein
MTAVYDANTGQWVERPPTTGTAPAGVSTGYGGVALRNTNGRNVQGQMNGLLRGDSDYMRINEKKGQQFAAGRGLLNSSLAGQAGRSAAIAGAQPIAIADAQLQAQADAQNVDALNELNIANIARQTASASASGSGSISGFGAPNVIDSELEQQRRMAIMRLQSELNISEAQANNLFEADQNERDRGLTREEFGLRRDESAAERDFRRGEGALDRNLSREEWDRQRDENDRQRGHVSTEAERDRSFMRETSTREARQSMFANVMNQSMSTIFSSPDFFRDPAAASGFLEFFTSQFGSLFDRFFGPGGP